jgi:FtsP/CotA-like multicopper oxidase with cupredoxin domain
VHIENDSGDVHPMHLHGHHAVVLSRNGTPATGSPLVVRLAQRAAREGYDIALTGACRVGGTSGNEPE